MKKAIFTAGVMMSLVSFSTLCASESIDITRNNTVDDDHAYETVTHINDKKSGSVSGEEWSVTGDIRGGYLYYDYANSPKSPDAAINKGHMDSHGVYVIPKISLSSPDYNGLRFKITGAGATDFGINDPLYESRNFVFDPTDKASFAILQEAYASYMTSDGSHQVVIGAKETVTPMVDADDWYMLANSFQGAYYINKYYEQTMFAVGYFYKMAGVWDSGANGTQWHSMSDASFVDSGYKVVGGDEGVWAGAFQYSDETHNLQVWDYYMQDYYNTFFAQYDYTGKYYGVDYDAGIQFIDFQGVGGLKSYYRDMLGGREIDYSVYSFRLNAKHDNGVDLALGASFYSDGDGTQDTLGAWGGYPYFANGMIFHFFEAGSLRNANSYKAQLGYAFNNASLKGLWVGARYTYFDLDPSYSFNGRGEAQGAMRLYGLRVSYGGDDGFYFTGTYERVDLDKEPNTQALRLIGGYKF